MSDHRAVAHTHPNGPHPQALPAALLDLLGEGVALFDAQGRCCVAGAPLAALLGCAPETLPGRTLAELLPELPPPDHALLCGALEGHPAALTWHDQARERWLELRATPLPAGGLLCVRDISAERQAELLAARAVERAAQIQTITAALACALTPDEVAGVIVSQAAQAMGAAAGIVALADPDGAALDILAVTGYPDSLIEQYRHLPLVPGTPLTDTALTREPVLIESRAAAAERYPLLAGSHALIELHAWANLPLLLEERLLGVIEISFSTPRRFSSEDRTFLTTLAQQCTQALERARLYAAEREARANAERAAQRTARLQEVTATLAEALTPTEVAATVVQQGVAALGARAGSLALLDPTGATLEVLGAVGYPPELLEGWRCFSVQQTSLLADAVRRGELLLLESPEQRDVRYPGSLRTIAADQAWAAVPLLVEGRAVGGLGLSFAQAQRFSEEDVQFMHTLAQQCAQALERARLYEEAQQARARAERAADRTLRLQQVAAALSEALTPAQVGAVVVEQGMQALGAQVGNVSLLSVDGLRLELLHQIGYSPEELARTWPMPLDQPSPMADTLRAGMLVFVESTDWVAQRYPVPPGWRPTSASVVLAPLTIEGRPIGGMSLGFKEPRLFSDGDRVFVQALAQQAAQAIERARLYEVERAARAEAEAALGVREIFFSVAAHELKTPLTSLLGQAQLFQRRAQREGSLSERDSRSLALVIDQALRLSRMVSALLDISRIDQGRLSIERQPLDLGALVRRVVDEVEPTLDKHRLHFELAGAPLLVGGDALRLEQVLQNLLNNAIKYSPLGGTVLVRAGRQGDRVLVAVADEGIGIPTEALPKLFTRFYRAANVEDSSVSGLGIGLYVVREIIALHGGEVTIESVEGQGSTFTVVLPALV
ncbi:MAG: hypothetical protein OHK0022_57940 [Roseiflexaceae bacterium]